MHRLLRTSVTGIGATWVCLFEPWLEMRLKHLWEGGTATWMT